MNIKKKAFIPAVLSVLLLTACSASDNGAAAEDYKFAAEAFSSKSDSYDAGGDETYTTSSEAENNAAASDNPNNENNTLEGAIKKEMLVYSCTMVVDVLDFDAATASFKSSLDTYGAFVENEDYDDGGSSSRWQYSDSEKWQTYTATVRVPSSSYDVFCDTAAQLGDLRSKNASVQNLSREYYDLSATLGIYEAKEARYMELLSTITDDQYAVAVEKELTDVQIEISKIKTRMNDIQTDVSYSYVYVTINEVKEYTEEPVKTDTFLQRLGNTASSAWSSFLNVMETLLFMFIYLLPHLAVIGLIIFIIIRIVKAAKKRRAASVPVPVSESVPTPFSESVPAPVSDPASVAEAEKTETKDENPEK